MKKNLSINEMLSVSETVVWNGLYNYATTDGLKLLFNNEKIARIYKRLKIYEKISKKMERELIKEINDIYEITQKIDGRVYGDEKFTRDLKKSQKKVDEIMADISQRKVYADMEK